MSRQPSHFRPQPSRDGAGNSPQRRTSLPASLIPWIVTHPLESPPEHAADDELPDHPELPSPNYAPTRQLLPPLSAFSHTNQLRTTDGSSSNSRTLPPLQEGVRLDYDPYSTSDSPASADYDDAHNSRVAPRRHQGSFTGVRNDPISVVSFPIEIQPGQPGQPRQPGQPHPPHNYGHGVGLSRPSSADLSTVSSSSLHGAPPPSHTSADTSTSVSFESSTARVRSWQRDQGQGEGYLMGNETGMSSGDAGRFTPTNEEVEYERRHGRRTHFPVSTIRGGPPSNRGYMYAYGTSSSSARGISGRHWTTAEEFGPNTPSWSNSEQEGEMESNVPARRGRGRAVHEAFRGEYSGSEAISSPAAPIPSQRNESVHSSSHDHSYAYMTWEPNRSLSERTTEPQRRESAFRLLPVHASGSSPGGNDAFYPSERYRSSQATSNVIRDAHPRSVASPSRRIDDSSGYVHVRARAGEVADPLHDLPYTSIPRYSAVPSTASHRVLADERRYVAEPEPYSYERSYERVPTRQSNRSQAMPVGADARTPIHEGITTETARSTVRPFLRGPGCGTPPPTQIAARSLHSPPRIQSHHNESLAQTQQIPGQRYGPASSSESPVLPPSAALARASNVPVSNRDEGTLVSLTHTTGTSTSSATLSATVTDREMRAPSSDADVRAQYIFPPEAQYMPRASQQLEPSSSINSSPPTKRSRSVSKERSGARSTVSDPTPNLPAGQFDPAGGLTSGRGRRGGQGRGRGRGRGKKVLNPASVSESAPTEQVMFWGREERLAHFGGANIVKGSTSISMPKDTSTQSIESSVRPQLLSLSSRPLPPLAAAEPSRTSRILAKKEKGRSDVGMIDESQVIEAKDYDEDTTDDEDRLEFSVGSAPSRSGSAGGSRAPKIKIEVACDFCRKRKMRCDGLRPTCRNCQRKNVECSYIAQVRRRGPGKKQKKVEARPKKTNRRVESNKKQTKGKGKAKAPNLVEDSLEAEKPLPSPRTPSPQASGSGLRQGAPTHRFVSGISPASNELYLPSPLRSMTSGAPASPLNSDALRLEQFSPDPTPLYDHNSPFGGDLFLRGHSPAARSIVDPPIDPSLRDSPLPNAVVPERRASGFSSGPSSSDETGRHSRRRRRAKRARTEGDNDEAELEDGEIDETGPSDAVHD